MLQSPFKTYKFITLAKRLLRQYFNLNINFDKSNVHDQIGPNV